MTPGALAAVLTASVSSACVVRQDEPMAKRTTLRVGGSADVYVEPASAEELSLVVRETQRAGLPLFILGRGSNLLVRDGGFRGVVVSLTAPHFSRIQAAGTELRAGAGARLNLVAIEARKNGLSGFEFLEGIPGTVGGALRMNAGAMGSSIFNTVISVEIMDRAGNIFQMGAQELQPQYRSCRFLEDHIALSALMKGREAPCHEIEARMREYSSKRWASQPAAPSAGCMFKNPETIPAGKLIDELGLKGTRVGGAMVSFEHGNFLVNDGTATSADVLSLMELVRKTAFSNRGVVLESEVLVIGEEAGKSGERQS